MLPEAFVLDPDRLARFEREARVLASLAHPAIRWLLLSDSADSMGRLGVITNWPAEVEKLFRQR